jgi:hypothetical protein
MKKQSERRVRCRLLAPRGHFPSFRHYALIKCFESVARERVSERDLAVYRAEGSWIFY